MFLSLPKINQFFFKVSWLLWLSGLTTSLQTKGLLVQFPVRQDTCLHCRPGLQLGVYERQPMDVSLPLFLPAFPSLQK